MFIIVVVIVVIVRDGGGGGGDGGNSGNNGNSGGSTGDRVGSSDRSGGGGCGCGCSAFILMLNCLFFTNQKKPFHCHMIRTLHIHISLLKLLVPLLIK